MSMLFRSPSLVLAAALFAGTAFADGTERLDPPVGLVVAPGSEVLLAGTGMKNQANGTITVQVPLAVQIKQVIAYWEGQALTETEHGASDTIMLGGKPVTGRRIGGPTHFFSVAWTSTYRADVTALGLVTNGNNSVSVSGLDFGTANNGVSLAVIIDDGVNTANVALRDGNDCAYANFASPLDTTEPVVYTFAPSSKPRTASLGWIVGSIALERPSIIEVYVDNVLVLALNDALGNLNGAEWDILTRDIDIPAGATSVRTRILSKDSGTGRYMGKLPASLTWITSSFVLAAPAQDYAGLTPGFWKNHRTLWDGVGSDDVTQTIKTTSLFNTVMGVTPAQSGVSDTTTVLDVIRTGGGNLIALNRHAGAALCNADSPLNYMFTLAQVIALYRDAVGADVGPETIKSAHAKFEMANEFGGGW